MNGFRCQRFGFHWLQAAGLEPDTRNLKPIYF